MRQIQLPGSAITTTPLAFGCGSLYRTNSESGRRRLLQAAFDAGIRHFDVAPLYGLGQAESDLGRFARGRRSEIVLATKFGLTPAGPLTWFVPAQSAVRWTLNMLPGLRQAVRKRADGFRQPANYTAQNATASLERSLKALGTDYIDLYMLHEPLLEQIPYADLYPLLERWRTAGKIRTYGVAGYYPEVARISAALPELCRVVQMDHDVLNNHRQHFVPEASQAVVTFSPFSSALPSLLAVVREHPGLCFEVSIAEGLSVTSSEDIAECLLAESLSCNESGVVIYSSGRPDRIARLARVGEFSRQRLLACTHFLEVLRGRLSLSR